jgi:hypothetical protein
VVRALALSVFVTVIAWGRFLAPTATLSPESQAPTINPACRVGTPQLVCLTKYNQFRMIDPYAPAWQDVPADYYFRSARIRGEKRPSWNPFVGSGYPIALDGTHSSLSPVQWFQTRLVGDQGRDVVAFVRFFFWTFGVTWLVALSGVSTALLAAVAVVATLAPYAAQYVDIVFLDVDLLSPWFFLVLLMFMTGRLALRYAVALCFALGLLIGVLGFLQSQVVYCVFAGLLALAAWPATRGRSLALAASLGAGFLVVVPSWLPLLSNLDQFVSSRNAQCVVQKGIGIGVFRSSFIRVLVASDVLATATFAGVVLLFSTPRKWWFVIAALGVMQVWIVTGLPHFACSLPLVSGVRFARHLVPHLEVLFIFGVAVAIEQLSESLDKPRPWCFALAAFLVSVGVAIASRPAHFRPRVLAYSAAGAALVLAVRVLRDSSKVREATRRGAFGLALAIFAFTPYVFRSKMALLMFNSTGRAGSPEVPALPDHIDPARALGQVQRSSQLEDRRHYSPSGFVNPNWSAALGILDMLSLNALYPVGYHELNGSLFSGWVRDPSHALVPDRFVAAPIGLAMSAEFQRVMVLNRVSLLTFATGNASFAEPGSPYESGACELLARDDNAESYKCTRIGGIGYFPDTVEVVRSRREAIQILQSSSPAKLAGMAVLGPEIDLSIGSSKTPDATPGSGRVVSATRHDDDLTYVLDVDREGVFVIADTYFRGWVAEVNAARAGISRANVAFKAVNVPRGHVELKLHFSVVP